MMSRPAGLLLAAWALAAQAPPAGVVRGKMLECEVEKGAGELSLRTATHQVYRFTFDAKTYFERDTVRSSAERLQAGDLLEVVSDHAAGSVLSYARTVHVLDQEAPIRRQPLSAGRYRAYRGRTDPIVPAGNLTFAGVVRRLAADRLLLRTRTAGEHTILLRADTRYLEDGVQVGIASLTVQTRVFVRGARNFDDEIEAYQVIWGNILEPGTRP